MNNDNLDAKDSYNLPAINDALDTLGMLSSITHSRKEYIQENENFFCKLQHLNMNGDKPGPSCVKEFVDPFDKHYIFNIDKPSNVDLMDPKEKENKVFDGLRIVTMNSQFITSFKAGYSFPLNELTDAPGRWVLKGNQGKRKCRSHPYEKKTFVKVVEQCVDSLNELDQTANRLRTASLSSGTSNKRKVLRSCEKTEKNSGFLKRCRSLENLRVQETPPFIECDKAKDIETVSKGIQEMQMEDCT